MKIRECKQWTFVLVTVTALTATLGSGFDVAAADDKPVQPVPDGEVVGDDVAPEFEPAELSDPAFDRYVSLELIRGGVVTGNAGLIIDAALQLHEGERILLRQRKGVSADQMLDRAVTVALQKGDKDSIARLGKAAEALKKPDLAKKVASVKDLVAASRSVDVRTQVDPKLSPEGRFVFEGLADQIDLAVTLNNVEALSQISKAVAVEASLDDKHKGLLQGGIKSAKEQIGDSAGERPELLTSLMGSSRSLTGGLGTSRIDYKIKNLTKSTVKFSLHGSGKSYSLAPGATGTYFATFKWGYPPYILVCNNKYSLGDGYYYIRWSGFNCKFGR